MSQVFEFSQVAIETAARRQQWMLWPVIAIGIMPAFFLGVWFVLFAVPLIVVAVVYGGYGASKRKNVDLGAGLLLDDGGLILGPGERQKSIFYEEIQTVAVQCAPDKSLVRISLSGPNGGFSVGGLRDMDGFRAALAAARPQAQWNVSTPCLDTWTFFFQASVIIFCGIIFNLFFLITMRLGWSRYIGVACAVFSFISIARRNPLGERSIAS